MRFFIQDEQKSCIKLKILLKNVIFKIIECIYRKIEVLVISLNQSECFLFLI